MKWAKSLILSFDESIEHRLETILFKIFNEHQNAKCIISSIDATGRLGNEFTIKVNNGEEIQTDIKKIISLAKEEGQILELDLLIIAEGNFRILITDGQHIDILSEDRDISSLIGKHIDIDSQLFNG